MEKKDLKKRLVVTYVPSYAKNDEDDPAREVGVITSWNDSFVFVRYGNDRNSKATRIEDLKIGDQTFYCPDEHNSVTDGAFGRCATICSNCKRNRDLIKKKRNAVN